MKIGRPTAWYLAFGGLFFLFWLLFKMGGQPDIPLALLSTTIDVLVTMTVLVTTVEYLLPRLVYRKKWGLFAACFFALVALGGSLIILSQLRLLGRSLSTYQQDIARYPKHYFYWFWADLVFGSYFMTFFIPATGAAVRLAFRSIEASGKVEKLEKEKALSELELLKHQINPHFLFNALNTIYYTIDRNNAPAREILQQFSHMLRYQLYECDRPFVEVEKELLFIHRYIELQQQRLNDNYTVHCEGFEEVKGLTLSPFLLMPLVENCFKHVSRHTERGNTITVRCSSEGTQLVFYTCNSILPAAEGEKGIGLENIKKRLELIYPGRHEFITRQTPDHFEAILKLEC